MPAPITGGLDTRNFDAALREYLIATKRDMADAMNKKAWYVARKAIWFTKRVEKEKILHELGAAGYTELVAKKRGTGYRKSRKVLYAFGSGDGVSRMHKILIARLRKAGKPIPTKAELDEMGQKVVRARLASVNYVRSGWLPAVNRLKSTFKPGGSFKPVASIAGARQIGAAKGNAVPARSGINPVAAITNTTMAKKHGANQAGKILDVAQAGIQRALDDEAASMAQFVQASNLRSQQAFNARGR